MDDIQKHFRYDSIIHSDLDIFNNETKKSIYIDKKFNKDNLYKLQNLKNEKMILILIKDKTSLDENVKESSLHDVDHYIKQIDSDSMIHTNAYNKYSEELNNHAKSKGLKRQEVYDGNNNYLLGYKYIKPYKNTNIKAIYDEYEYKNLKNLEIKNRLYEHNLEDYSVSYWIDSKVIPENELDKKKLDNFHNKKGEYHELYKGGKRKTRRNRKSKKGKRSRKARKSRRKSNRRRGRR